MLDNLAKHFLSSRVTVRLSIASTGAVRNAASWRPVLMTAASCFGISWDLRALCRDLPVVLAKKEAPQRCGSLDMRSAI